MQDTPEKEEIKTPPQPPKRKPLWRRVLRWTAITLLSVVALFIIVCSLVVWILTPPRLTPIVEKYATEYLDASVSIKRVELSFWSTFPRLTVEVDSLDIVSHSLRSLPAQMRATLPADADSLMSLKGFSGGVNVLQLLAGNIHLHDVLIDSPRVNILQVNDSVANYLIFPTEEKPDTATTPLSLPDIQINSFRILSAGPLRYRSMADSTDISASIKNVDLGGDEAPLYRLELTGGANIPMLKELALDPLVFGIDGRLDWKTAEPLKIALSDMKLTLDEYALLFSTQADFSGAPVINTFKGAIENLAVQKLLRHIPAEMQKYAAPLHTDMILSATAELTRPYVLTDTILPSFKATLSIPACKASYESLILDELSGDLAVDFVGTDINKSVFDLRKFTMKGAGVNCRLNAKVTNALSDPNIDGQFHGTLSFARIPAVLASRIPLRLRGTMEGDTKFRFALSDLDPQHFHRLDASGKLTLTDFHADTRPEAKDSLQLFLHRGLLEFGTSDSFVAGEHKVDSLLRVSLKIDTLSANGMGMDIQVRDLAAGLGASNRSNSADTTEINPFGGGISVQRLKFDSPSDSIRIRLRKASIGGALRRFKGDARSPLIDLRVNAARMAFGQALTKFSLRETLMSLTINMHQHEHSNSGFASSPSAEAFGQLTPEERQQRRAERLHRDSLAAAQAIAHGDVDMRLDRKDRRLLRRWDYKGSLKAERGRLATPYFPLRNTLSHIDLRFNSDSVILSDLHYKAGQSDFRISGAVTNIRRALTSRRDNVLGLRLSIVSDTINVNQIVSALFTGTGAAPATSEQNLWEDDNDTAITEAPGDTVTSGPLLIPRNIDARMRMRARNILYSDLELHDFKGDLLMLAGTLNLRNLSASTDIGSLAVNGLYSSVNPDSLQFGLGMKIDRFYLDRVSRLVPAIDTIMPALQNFAGIVNADIAVTTDLYRNMDINIPSLRAAISIEGDSLVLLDPDTFKTVSKWLLFKNKKRNMIDHMSVEAVIDRGAIELYPFMFDIDRYRLGVMGHNDLAMNLNYHVSVLKSPIPFKFGINIKGTPEKLKVRLGGAKFKEKMVVERQQIADNTRINLVQQIDNMFRRGLRNARSGRLNFRSQGRSTTAAELDAEETVSYADSLKMIRAGLIDNPDTLRFPPHDPPAPEPKSAKGKRKRK